MEIRSEIAKHRSFVGFLTHEHIQRYSRTTRPFVLWYPVPAELTVSDVTSCKSQISSILGKVFTAKIYPILINNLPDMDMVEKDIVWGRFFSISKIDEKN